MKISTLVEVVSAAHLTFYVNSPFEERGGMLFVGPPASLKTAVTQVIDQYPTALLLSDLTVKTGARLREDIVSNKVTTLAFADMAKLYQRNSSGAANVEGFLRALTGEGFRRANWEDGRMVCVPARCLVVGSMTLHLYTQRYQVWMDDGFARRFIWSHFRLFDQRVIIESLIKGERLQFGRHGMSSRVPTSRNAIPYKVTEREAREIDSWLSFQPGKEIGYTLIAKMLCALKWRYLDEPKRPMQILEDFSASLSKDGAELFIDDDELPAGKKSKRKMGKAVASAVAITEKVGKRSSMPSRPAATTPASNQKGAKK